MSKTQELTDTSARTVFSVARPNNSNVTLNFGTDPTRPAMVLFTVPKGSTWHPELHWHELYDEYVYVRQGRCTVYIDGALKTVTSDDGAQKIPKFAVHEWFRADRLSQTKDDEDLIVEEWTDPADGIKQVFFRNLLSVIEDASQYWRSWTTLQLFLISDIYDNYDICLPTSLPYALQYYFTHGLLASFRLGSRILGLKPWYTQYTPPNLRAVAAEVGRTDTGVKKE